MLKSFMTEWPDWPEKGSTGETSKVDIDKESSARRVVPCSQFLSIISKMKGLWEMDGCWRAKKERRQKDEVRRSGSFPQHSISVHLEEFRIDTFVPFDDQRGTVALDEFPHTADDGNFVPFDIDFDERDWMTELQVVEGDGKSAI